MAQFTGTLNKNSVLTGLYNMIISQEVFSNNIVLKDTLVNDFRTDGTLYGDTKLFLSTDVGEVDDFPNTKNNLLTKRLPKDPKVQAVTVDTFKQSFVTIDSTRLKQAFTGNDIYGAFVSVSIQWLRDAFKVLNVTLINTYVGTVETKATRAVETVSLPKAPTGEGVSLVESQAYENLVGELIGKQIADIMVDLKDCLRDFNDYGFLRSYSTSDFMIVWNKSWLNRIKHISLPTIFNQGDVLSYDFKQKVINSRFFGDLITTAGTSTGVERTTEDMQIKDSGDVGVKQLFAGDIIPTGTPYAANKAYRVNTKIIAKIVHKKAIPFMSALNVETEFYNSKDLDRNHYMTIGYSTPTYLEDKPIITLKAN